MKFHVCNVLIYWYLDFLFLFGWYIQNKGKFKFEAKNRLIFDLHLLTFESQFIKCEFILICNKETKFIWNCDKNQVSRTHARTGWNGVYQHVNKGKIKIVL